MASIDLKGKTAIVTGPTSGIGKEIARGLARTGAKLVLAARNEQKAEAVRAELAREPGAGELRVMQLDVSSVASIRAFAERFNAESGSVSVLVNNAGAWFGDRRESVDGLELTFATNVLGPYLLTTLLAPSLNAGAPARVVNLTSGLAANYDANDLQFQTRKFDGFKVYAQSKQALRMVTWALAEKLGPKVTVNGASPGFVRTEFNQNAHGFMAAMIDLSAKLFAVSPAKGAGTPLWVATAAELEGQTAKYFDGMKEKDGKFREPGAIADLVRRLDEYAAGAARSKAS